MTWPRGLILLQQGHVVFWGVPFFQTLIQVCKPSWQLTFPIRVQGKAQRWNLDGCKSECSSKERQQRRLKAMLIYATNCSSTLGEVMETTCSLTGPVWSALPQLQNRFTSVHLSVQMEMSWDYSKVFVLGWNEGSFPLDYTLDWKEKEISHSRSES